MTHRADHERYKRRDFCASLAGGAAAMLGASLFAGRAAHAQSGLGAVEQLDGAVDGYPFDAEAREMLRWWTTPAAVTRAYLGGAGNQLHVRLAQPARPRRRPVVLVHDAGRSARAWDHALPLLARDRVVVAPDLPAHGDSDGDPLSATSTHAAAVMHVADRLGLGQFDLVGEGLGSHVAVTLAVLAPGRVGRLVLSGPGQRSLASPRPDKAHPEDAAFLATAWQGFRAQYSAATPLGLLDRDFADLLRTRSAAPRNNGALSLAASVAQDTLVLSSAGDSEAPALADALPRGQQQVSQHPGRGAASQHAADWVATVTAFLNRNTAPADAQAVALPSEPPSRGAIVRRFMATPGGQMHYRLLASGQQGPPLVCFHMSPRSAAYYEPLMSAVGLAERTVIAVDTAGYGESFKPPAWLDVPGYAAHMAAFLDALGAEEVDLLGDHTGSKIAVATARRRPDQVRRIVMNTAGVYSPQEQRGWQRRMGAIPVAADGSHYAALWQRYHALNRGKLDAAQNAFRFYETVRAGPCMWWGPRAANLYILGEVLPQVEHEILLVCSDQDSLLEPTRRGALLLRNGRYVEFAGLGNSMFEYRAAAVAPTIAAFLAG